MMDVRWIMMICPGIMKQNSIFIERFRVIRFLLRVEQTDIFREDPFYEK